MFVGNLVKGRFKALPRASYLTVGAESIPHNIYEARIKTTPMSLEEEENVLMNIMTARIPEMVVLGAETKADGSVRIQVTGSPFLWAPFIAILPSLIGPIITLIIGLIIVIQVPTWAWAALPIGVGGAILVYAVMKAKPKSGR